MSIPATADRERFTPPVLQDHFSEEDPPLFKLRHGTVMDRQNIPIMMEAEGCQQYNDQDWREMILKEMRADWESEGLEQNITQLERLWEARDEYAEVMRQHIAACQVIVQETPEGEKPVMPEQPELDFEPEMADELDLMVEQVITNSRQLSHMSAMRRKWNITYPRLVLRMLLRSTKLETKLDRHAKVVTAESLEQMFVDLEKKAQELDPKIKPGKASIELLLHAQAMMYLSRDEEKNSSAPHTGATSQKPSTGTTSKSTDESPSSAQTDTEEATG